MAAADIYNFEVVIPRAAKAVLTPFGLQCYTIEDDPVFQKIRPRVEIVYNQIGEVSPQRLAVLENGSTMVNCFRGELKLHAITDADVAGKVAHSAYRSLVRYGIAILKQSINGTHLLLHKVQFVQGGNEQTGIRNADGFQQTTFPFHVDVSIQNNAWEEL